jgi:hypothetical protein
MPATCGPPMCFKIASSHRIVAFLNRQSMPPADLTTSIRHCVQQLFAELNFGASEACRETILIRDGNYCGRRFEAAAGHAVWFVEEDQLKLVDAQGRVVRVVDQVSARGRDLRSAA